MSLSEHLTQQLEAEAEASRKVIERIPESIFEFRPHDKSWTTRELATHVANLVSWGRTILTTEVLDLESPEAKAWTPPRTETIADILELLRANSDASRSALSGMSDEDLEKTWELRAGDHVMASNSRLWAFSRWVLAHESHHRGELMVYLRLNDVPLPGIFGPTADERMLA